MPEIVVEVTAFTGMRRDVPARGLEIAQEGERAGLCTPFTLLGFSPADLPALVIRPPYQRISAAGASDPFPWKKSAS